MTSVNCVQCHDSNIKCYRCQIRQLKAENLSLKQELQKYYLIDNEQLSLTRYQQQDIDNNFIQQSTPLDYDYKDKLSNEYFITITFDPSKFGLQPYESERKDYILYQLTRLRNKDLFTDCYGCFEYHKNGIIHTHLIMNTAFPKEIYQILKSKFTDNSHNKVVLQIDKAKWPQAKDYINKESDHYYYTYNKRKDKVCSIPHRTDRPERVRKNPGSSEDRPPSLPGSNPLDYGLN